MTAPVVKAYQRHGVKTSIRTVSSAAAVIRDNKTEWETDNREVVGMIYVICIAGTREARSISCKSRGLFEL
jgi:hypothetical protein